MRRTKVRKREYVLTDEGEGMWTKENQILFDVIVVALRGLKNSKAISLDQHEKIIQLLQNAIDEMVSLEKYIKRRKKII